MEKLTLEEIKIAVNGELILKGNTQKYTRVNTDTRTLSKGDIFIALKGEKFDANEFIEEASDKGANLCIVSDTKFNKDSIKEETSVILVEDTYKALLDLGKYYREKLNLKIVGITGSTGKTSTKDVVAAALSGKYKVFKTKGNFNNEIGLPLMLMSLDNSYEVAVLEMGMSNLGEIHRLSEVAKPDVAIITNIGISHIENLKTRENILKAKMEIVDFFQSNNTLIVNGDDEFLSTVKKKNFNLIKVGINGNNHYWGENIILNEDGISYQLKEKSSNVNKKITLNMIGKHNVYNSLLAIACARELDVSYEEIIKGFENIEATSMRLDFIKGKKFTIINDCYNSSPDSVKAAIDVLINVKCNRKIAILGTMRELGHIAYEAHRQVAEYAKEKGIDYLFSLGEFEEAFRSGFGEQKFKQFDDLQQLEVYMKDFLQKDDCVLVKASRYMKFENVVEKLQIINY
ncbi:UDP-N-acetylmuramoyl-tripeptide--D-alanyl-D-alanine ligase [Clostridium sp. KNHs214]|uniref:UDP-N-acetylmuramoyl-tripeptide--D-alanyl-D- alanine ligase n=1 Tax=Clostridium sp. KNHs214 TaxID=1540257 RepID=UPI00054FE231|nr:UDP-N-acetylmuramoyl-tripeptide--D-alanyl-D-alanine ligase [Clostridium sp. KNHs214]